MKKSIIIMLTLGLIIASGTAYAATVDLHGLTKVAPSKGTFFFDVDISDVGSLPNWDSWQLFLTMTGGTNANFVNYSNLATNEDYLFFGDSGDYSFFWGAWGSLLLAVILHSQKPELQQRLAISLQGLPLMLAMPSQAKYTP
jgi:hypothetical protein